MNASAIADMLNRPVQPGISGHAEETNFALRQGLRQQPQKAPEPEIIPPTFDASAVNVDIRGFGESATAWNLPQSLIDISI
jgi:hypothetical protein